MPKTKATASVDTRTVSEKIEALEMELFGLRIDAAAENLLPGDGFALYVPLCEQDKRGFSIELCQDGITGQAIFQTGDHKRIFGALLCLSDKMSSLEPYCEIATEWGNGAVVFTAERRLPPEASESGEDHAYLLSIASHVPASNS